MAELALGRRPGKGLTMRMFLLIVSALLAVATPHIVSAADAAPIPREGSSTILGMGSATSKALPLGKDRVQLSWEYLGAQTALDGVPLTDNATSRCVGSLRAFNGEYEEFTNACVFTRPDGDQLFWTEREVTGRMGSGSKGTGQFVGGTGKLAGITGRGEWTRVIVRPAAEGTFQTVARIKVTYKLP
jgi:hypothetical protein